MAAASCGWLAARRKCSGVRPGLGDLLARQRQFRVALRLIELRRSGAANAGLDTLGSQPDDLMHPFTREKLRLSKRGALDVLAFTSGTSGAFTDEDGNPVNELLWRVPAGTR
ncbi:MAG TPA: hypothetical protein VMM36_01710 [Opitutaceae bacterium]|nr:hypothetical protein [Opitutaceae bacterium]